MTRRRRPQYPPPPGRRVSPSPDVCRLLLCNTRPACTALPADFGPRWSTVDPTFCHPAVPNAVVELPKRPFFSCLFWTLSFGRFGGLFLRSGLILETSASQKPMFSLGKTMICTFAPFPLPARFFIENARKGAKKEPKNRVISISIFRVPLFFGPEAVGKRHRSLPGALSEDLGPPGRPLGLLSEASGPHLGASEAYLP